MEKRRLIIDCDPGIDDALALFLALSYDNIEIVGITIVGGNTTAMKCGLNALRVLTIADRLDIPVYLGEEKPLVRELEKAEDTHGDDGLGGGSHVKVDPSLLKLGAINFIVNESKKANTHLVSLGPMTNIAVAMKQDLSAINNLESITSMGGSYRAGGNVSQVAEFNYWVDPHAASFVYRNFNKPINMIGLDVTKHCILTPNLRELLWQINTEKSRFIHEISRVYIDYYFKVEQVLGSLIHDALALAYFLEGDICSGFDSNLEMVIDGPAMGMSMIDNKNYLNKEINVHVLTEVNTKKFMELFFKENFKENTAIIDNVLNLEYNRDISYK